MSLSFALQRTRRWVTVVLLAALVAACGGSDEHDHDRPPPEPEPAPAPAPEPPPGVGDLLSATAVNRITPQQISAALAQDASKIAGVVPLHAVQSYRLTYRTVDKDGALVVGSGLVAVPERTGGAPSPLVSYQHATTFTNANAPSLKVEPAEPPIVLASLGYIVVASDYVGFGASQGQQHPYLQSGPTARAVIDMLVAAQAWLRAEAVPDNGQLFLVGYSEGGYATMAAQRELTRSASPLLGQLVAALPAAGPYDVQVTLDVQLQRVREQYPALAWALDPGNLRHLGSSVRNEIRRALLRLMIPDDADVAYQTKFLDDYMADDRQAILRDSSVHWGWTPTAPVFLFHGRDDRTVPFEASVSAYDSLRVTGGAPVTLSECTEPSSGHLECVPQYFRFAVAAMARMAAP